MRYCQVKAFRCGVNRLIFVTDYNFIYREAVRHADALLKQLDNGKNG